MKVIGTFWKDRKGARGLFSANAHAYRRMHTCVFWHAEVGGGIHYKPGPGSAGYCGGRWFPKHHKSNQGAKPLVPPGARLFLCYHPLQFIM
jgi:hypothetical protein